VLRDQIHAGAFDRGPKVGTHVAQGKYDHGLDALLGLEETFKGHGEVRNEVRAAMEVAAPPSVALRLELEPGGGSSGCVTSVTFRCPLI
jgi:GntR family transcriptional regulator